MIWCVRVFSLHGETPVRNTLACVLRSQTFLRSFSFADYPFVARAEKKFGACTNFVINPLFTIIINFSYKLSRLLLIEDQV